MRVFISGGCKNGKSTYAQHLAQKQGQGRPLYYIATMAAVDNEDEERILRHQNERDGWGFVTVEQPRNIEEILEKCDTHGSFLLDSLTALLSNEMFQAGKIDMTAHERIAQGLKQILQKIDNIVIVSDYIYSDAFLYDELTEGYRKALATLDRLAAQQCDIVLEAAYTSIVQISDGKTPPICSDNKE